MPGGEGTLRGSQGSWGKDICRTIWSLSCHSDTLSYQRLQLFSVHNNNSDGWKGYSLRVDPELFRVTVMVLAGGFQIFQQIFVEIDTQSKWGSN